MVLVSGDENQGLALRFAFFLANPNGSEFRWRALDFRSGRLLLSYACLAYAILTAQQNVKLAWVLLGENQG